VARRIRFTSSGGIAGQIRGCDLSVDELPEAARKGLTGLMKAKTVRKSKSARDALHYEIEIVDDDGARKKLSFDELSLPESAESLLEFLNSRSKWRPPD
jgi:hypothetical protein